MVTSMTKIKITVVKAFSPEEVFGHSLHTKTGTKITKCKYTPGQTWTTENMRRPEGFCDWAWQDMRKDLYLLTFGGDISDTEPGVIYIPCSDGKRPVVFKLERLNE